MMQRSMAPVMYTIGHSARSLDEFVGLLRASGIGQVLDVRTVPRSRHNPQFNRDTLPAGLSANGIAYSHWPGLGGLRRSHAGSPNTGWRNLSFRGYADYMQTPEFAENVERLVDLAGRERCVLMCAEAVPWRCHRSLIADALLVRGVRVEEIIGMQPPKAHRLTRWAKVDGTTVTYPPDAAAMAADTDGSGERGSGDRGSGEQGSGEHGSGKR